MLSCLNKKKTPKPNKHKTPNPLKHLPFIFSFKLRDFTLMPFHYCLACFTRESCGWLADMSPIMTSGGARKPLSPTDFSPSCAYSKNLEVPPVLKFDSTDKVDASSISVKR